MTGRYHGSLTKTGFTENQFWKTKTYFSIFHIYKELSVLWQVSVHLRHSLLTYPSPAPAPGTDGSTEAAFSIILVGFRLICFQQRWAWLFLFSLLLLFLKVLGRVLSENPCASYDSFFEMLICTQHHVCQIACVINDEWLAMIYLDGNV